MFCKHKKRKKQRTLYFPLVPWYPIFTFWRRVERKTKRELGRYRKTWQFVKRPRLFPVADFRYPVNAHSYNVICESFLLMQPWRSCSLKSLLWFNYVNFRSYVLHRRRNARGFIKHEKNELTYIKFLVSVSVSAPASYESLLPSQSSEIAEYYSGECHSSEGWNSCRCIRLGLPDWLKVERVLSVV